MDKLITFFSDFFLGWANSLLTIQANRIFWFLLALVALGGVLCAVLGKKSVVNRGICGTLELAVLYLTAMLLFAIFPTLQHYFDLPFLAVMDSWIVLINPLSLRFVELAPIMVRFLLLVFSINLADSLIVSGDNPAIWLCTQLISLVVGVALYIILITGINFLMPSLLGRWAVLMLGGLILLIAAYLIFTVFSEENGEMPNQSLTKRLTSSRGGALVVISFLSLVLTMVLLCMLPKFQLSVWDFHDVLSGGYLVILLLFLVALCIYSMLFHDRRRP